jgi:hypothetical protein
MALVKEFLVSTADFAMYYNGILACTGTTNLNTSIDVSLQEQNVNGGKGNGLVYSYKYGRELSVSLEAANWDLRYLATNLGNDIINQLADIYAINECIQLTAGVGTLPKTPIGDVAVMLDDGTIVTTTPTAKVIDISETNEITGMVRVTYKYSGLARTIVIDADTAPKIYRLVLDADRHNSAIGKVGSLQIEIPSYQPSGTFTMGFTAEGVNSTNIDGKAISVAGDTCASGSAVYAYVREYNTDADVFTVDEIVATPSAIAITGTGTSTIKVRGLKDNYMPIAIDNSDCTFASSVTAKATVGTTTGIVTGVSAGTSVITVSYVQGGVTLTDTVNVTVS